MNLIRLNDDEIKTSKIICDLFNKQIKHHDADFIKIDLVKCKLQEQRINEAEDKSE